MGLNRSLKVANTQGTAMSKYQGRDKKPMLIEDQKRLRTFGEGKTSLRPASKLDRIKI